jgi:hypothetical protein
MTNPESGTDGTAAAAGSDITDPKFSLGSINSDDPEADISSLAAFVRANPTRPDALLALAVAFLRADKVDSAKQAIRRVRFLAPEIASVLPTDDSPDVDAVSAALKLLIGGATPVSVAPLDEPATVSEDGRADELTVWVQTESETEPPIAVRWVPVMETVAVLPVTDTAAASRSGREAWELAELRPVEAGQLTAPPASGELPDGWMLARLSLELWVRRFAAWPLPLLVCNVLAAAGLERVGEASLPQALVWQAAFALGAPFCLRGMAREWSPEAVVGDLPRDRGRWAAPVTLLLFAIGAAACAVLATRVPVRGEDLLALGMPAELSLLALLAPAVMLWATGRGGLREGLQAVKRSLSRRMWTYLAVVVGMGSAGGAVILTLGWGFLTTLGVIDPLWIRLFESVWIALAESFVLVVIATCGLDALESRLRPTLTQEELAAG